MMGSNVKDGLQPERNDLRDLRLALAENSENLRHLENQRFVVLNSYLLIVAAIGGYVLAEWTGVAQNLVPAVAAVGGISAIVFLLVLRINIEYQNCEAGVLGNARALGLATALQLESLQSKVGTRRVQGGWKRLLDRAGMESHLAFSLPVLRDLNQVFFMAPLKHLTGFSAGGYVGLTLLPAAQQLLGGVGVW